MRPNPIKLLKHKALLLLLLVSIRSNAQEIEENNVDLFGGNNSAFGDDPFNNGEDYENFNPSSNEPAQNGFGLEGNQELYLNNQQAPSSGLYSDPIQAESYGLEEPVDFFADADSTPNVNSAPLAPDPLLSEPQAPLADPLADVPETAADPFAAPLAPDPLLSEPQAPLADPLADVPETAADPFAAPFETDPTVPITSEEDPLAGVKPEESSAGFELDSGSAPVDASVIPAEITIGSDPLAQPEQNDPIVNGIRESELIGLRKAIAELKPKRPGSFPDEYIVQPGDTLWDISDQLLDDPFWWPKLWSYNPGIINPHLIVPGMRIVFESSNGVLPPGVSLTDSGDFLPVAVSDADMGIKRNPLVQAWRELNGTIVTPDEIPDSEQFDIFGELKLSASQYISVPGFLSAQQPRFFAEVSRMDSQRWAASKGDIVYTESTEGWAPEAGEKFLVVREQIPAQDTKGSAISPGFWLYSGVVGVVGRERTGRIRLIVEETREGVQPGDKIVPFQDLLKPVFMNVDREPRDTSAVVAAIGNGEQTLATLLDVIHLIGNTSDIRVGDLVAVYTHPSGPLFPDEQLEFAQSGYARIIEISGNTAMGVVIRVDKEIALGSQTAAGLAIH